MAATTLHPDPLPSPSNDDDHEREDWSPSGWRMMGCIASLAALIFFAGLVVGALWL